MKDARRLHASVHRDMTCLDCHGDIDPEGEHPDPDLVDQQPRWGFSPERCYDCHDGIEEELAENRHGDREVKDAARFLDCIRCHDPHYALPLGADRPAGIREGSPYYTQCDACHEKREQLPKPDEDTAACYQCHVAEPEDAGLLVTKQSDMCLSCHGRQELSNRLPVLAAETIGGEPHGSFSCLECHGNADQFPHKSQYLTDCRSCHEPHDEAVAGDAHVGVDCRACHLEGVLPVRKQGRIFVTATVLPAGDGGSPVHGLVKDEDHSSCRRCHHPGNAIGASAMVLPAKGLLCMPCHAATLSLPDVPSMIGLGIFFIGLIGAVSFWMTGSAGTAPSPHAPAESAGRKGPSRARRIASALLGDALLQRRLWRVSRLRWGIHALIFFPFVLRFLWGLATLILMNTVPGSGLAQAMVDKNDPLTTLFFEITGLMVLAGVAGAMWRRFSAWGEAEPAGMPKPDWPAVGLLGGIVIVGFILEGMRISMTGAPGASELAFLGSGIAEVFASSAWVGKAYGYVWYLHNILTAAFVAYLPFSRMFHLVVAPLNLAAKAWTADHHDQG